MPSFYDRLRKYYADIAIALQGEAAAAAIFPNGSDVGGSREQIYAEVLKLHAPTKCNVFQGGFLFHMDGRESGQLDVIVTIDTAMRFDFLNRNGGGKSFAPVEGTIGIASIKSNLTKEKLFEALENIASIPPMEPLGTRVNPLFQVNFYEDFPFKVLYATDGPSLETMLANLVEFYTAHPGIPLTRRPHIIHVLRKYVVVRVTPSLGFRSSKTGEHVEAMLGTFRPISSESDLQGLTMVLMALNENAMVASHINFTYEQVFNRVNDLTSVRR